MHEIHVDLDGETHRTPVERQPYALGEKQDKNGQWVYEISPALPYSDAIEQLGREMLAEFPGSMDQFGLALKKTAPDENGKQGSFIDLSFKKGVDPETEQRAVAWVKSKLAGL